MFLKAYSINIRKDGYMKNMVRIKKVLFSFLFCFFCLVWVNVASSHQTLILSTTTSVLDSGLLDVLVPMFEKENNCKVKVIAVGTGQTIKIAQDGNADVILVHDRKSEELFIKQGYGVKRYDVAYNYFIIVGPKKDPAKIETLSNTLEVLNKIFKTKSLFISRGDNSGTQKKELSLWAMLKLKPQGKWYLQSGTGMESTLRIASEKQAYCLTDKATYLAHRKELDLEVLFNNNGNDKLLINFYSVIAVSPQKYPFVNNKLAVRFIKFLRSKKIQDLIANFGKDKYGEALFYVN